MYSVRPTSVLLRLAAILCPLMVPAVAIAGPCAPKDQRCLKAQELVVAMGYRESARSFIARCEERAQEFRPSRLRDSDPAMFKNLKPSSTQWSAVEAAFLAFQQRFCGKTLDQLVEAYRDAWASRLTVVELDAVLSFLASSQGRSFATKSPTVYAAVLAQMAPLWQAEEADAIAQYEKSIRALAAR